jgi:hypothetical protein
VPDVWVHPEAHKIVAHLPEVVAHVRAEADLRAKVAALYLSRHRDTGDAHIEVISAVPDKSMELRPGAEIDALVCLVASGGDIAAQAIELGRAGYTNSQGHQIGPMQGIHALGKAFGSVA